MSGRHRVGHRREQVVGVDTPEPGGGVPNDHDPYSATADGPLRRGATVGGQLDADDLSAVSEPTEGTHPSMGVSYQFSNPILPNIVTNRSRRC